MEEKLLELLRSAGVTKGTPRLEENLARFLRVLDMAPDLLESGTLRPLLDRVLLDLARGSDAALVRLELLVGAPPVPPSGPDARLQRILAGL